MLELQLERTNDYLLEATVGDIIGWLPPEISCDAECIFVARIPDFSVNAEALAYASNARVAFVYQGISSALIFYAYLFRRTFRFIRTIDGSSAVSLGDMMRLAIAEVPRLLHDPDVQIVLETRARWLNDVDITSDLEDLLIRFDDVLPSGSIAINELHDIAEHFVVAHEMAHHLLGHTHHKAYGYRHHPARQRLLELRQILKVSPSEKEWNEDQLKEFDADAFAFLALAGEVRDPSGFKPSMWYGAMSAAFVALPTLEDQALIMAAEAGGGPAEQLIGQTHPPVHERIQQLFDLVAAFPKRNDSDPHPIGLLVQAEIFRSLLAAARKAGGPR